MTDTSSVQASSFKTCFISAPAGAQLGVLRGALEARGLRLLVPQNLSPGGDWSSEVQRQLLHADLVIGVLTSERQSPWVLFELGQAFALGRRIVLITSPNADLVPSSLHQVLIIRAGLDNQEAIGFALDQILSAPKKVSPAPAKRPSPRSVGLGSRADELINTLNRALLSNDWQSVESVVGEAVLSSGVDVIVGSTSTDVGAAYAVWSDIWEPFVGNPLLIEVKAAVRGKDGAVSAIHQVTSLLEASGAQWALLLYGEGPGEQAWSVGPPNVLVLSIRSFLDALRTQSLPELVRDRRNQLVHGIVH